MLFWAVWGVALGVLVTLWVRRMPSLAEYREFLRLLGARGPLLEQRTQYYIDVRLGVAEWRRRRYWRRRIATMRRAR